MITKDSTAREVYAYAVEHYNDGGWDVIVECWSLDELSAMREKDGNWDTLFALVDIWADRQADAINSAF